jgi:hypothetical protein
MSSSVVMSGPTVYGAYVDPPRVLGLDLDGLGREEVVKLVSQEGTRIAWQMELGGRIAMLTHAGGLFIEFPKRPASKDPADESDEIDADRREAVEIANLVLCDLAISCAAYASAFSIVDLAAAKREDDRVQVWAAPLPFAPAALRVQSAVFESASELDIWPQTPPQKLERLGTLESAIALKAVALNLPAFVAAAHGHAYRQRPAECLLFAWMTCEQLLSHLWEENVASAGLDGAHRKRLRDGRTFSAAVQAETLRVIGRIPDDTYNVVSRARKQRNDLAHDGKLDPTAIEVALDALYGMLDTALDQPTSDKTS